MNRARSRCSDGVLSGIVCFASNLILPSLFPFPVKAGHLGLQILNTVQQLLDCTPHRVRHEMVIQVNAMGGDAALMGRDDRTAWDPNHRHAGSYILNHDSVAQ